MKIKSGIKAIVSFVLIIIIMGACKEKGNPVGIFDDYADIGGVKLIGNIVYDIPTKTYTLSGGGINVWGANDQFFYAWKKVKGNFRMTAKLAFEGQGVDAHRKIGIMLRDELTGEARCAHISFHGDGLTSLQYRSETGGITREEVGPPHGNYIVLEKVGNKIMMKSATGILPQAVTAEIEMDFPGNFYVGIFICSHNADVLETAHFTNVEYVKL
jgi:hypothetical protein